MEIYIDFHCVHKANHRQNESHLKGPSDDEKSIHHLQRVFICFLLWTLES